MVAQRDGMPLPTANLYLCTPAADLGGIVNSLVNNARDRDMHLYPTMRKASVAAELVHNVSRVAAHT